MPYAKTDDIEIYYESHGSGPALVFAHGFTLDHRLWGPQVEYFSGDYQVVTFDSRGHGKSSAPLTGYSRDHREADMLAVVDALGLEKFHLIGLSMGGATSVGFAVDYRQRLQSLVLVSAGITGFNPTRHQDSLTKIAREQGIEAARKRWMHAALGYYRDHPGPTADLMSAMMAEHSGGPWGDPNRGQYQHRDDLQLLKSLDLPALILVGGRDLNFIPMGEKLHQALAGSTLEILPNVGHIINLEAPELFNQRLESWLQSQ